MCKTNLLRTDLTLCIEVLAGTLMIKLFFDLLLPVLEECEVGVFGWM